jgi:hypothetical protein
MSEDAGQGTAVPSTAYQRLAERFPAADHKRVNKGGRDQTYIPWTDKVERFNEVLGQDWSFRVVREGMTTTEAWVLGELSVTIDGVTTVRQQYGCEAIVKGQRETPTTDELLQAALEYAPPGLGRLPGHTPINGVCDCRGGRTLQELGKHPWTRNGLSDATTDELTIRRWWKERADRQHRARVPRGTSSWTWTASTGSAARSRRAGSSAIDGRAEVRAGRPLRLPHPRAGRTAQQADPESSKGAHDGVDLRGPGGYIVAAPSLHASGGSTNGPCRSPRSRSRRRGSRRSAGSRAAPRRGPVAGRLRAVLAGLPRGSASGSSTAPPRSCARRRAARPGDHAGPAGGRRTAGRRSKRRRPSARSARRTPSTRRTRAPGLAGRRDAALARQRDGGVRDVPLRVLRPREVRPRAARRDGGAERSCRARRRSPTPSAQPAVDVGPRCSAAARSSTSWAMSRRAVDGS